jgi:hypothetical protein
MFISVCAEPRLFGPQPRVTERSSAALYFGSRCCARHRVVKHHALLPSQTPAILTAAIIPQTTLHIGSGDAGAPQVGCLNIGGAQFCRWTAALDRQGPVCCYAGGSADAQWAADGLRRSFRPGGGQLRKWSGSLDPEVDPIGRTTGTAFLIGNLAVPIS